MWERGYGSGDVGTEIRERRYGNGDTGTEITQQGVTGIVGHPLLYEVCMVVGLEHAAHAHTAAHAAHAAAEAAHAAAEAAHATAEAAHAATCTTHRSTGVAITEH